MNPEIKAEWLAELPIREQGRGALRTADGTWCCLGVLCDVAARHGIGDWSRTDENDYEFWTRGEQDGSPALPPPAIRDWAGLPHLAGIALTSDEIAAALSPDELAAFGETEKWTLAELNDNGASFEMIAKLIDRYL